MGEQQRDRAPRIVKFRHFNVDLRAELHRENQTALGTCASCGAIPEVFHKLDCPHLLCLDCAAYTKVYTCATHRTTTDIPVPLRGPMIVHEALKNATVVCPGCSHCIRFEKIKAHITRLHLDLCKQGNQRTTRHEQAYHGTNTKNRVPPAKADYSSCGAEDQKKAPNNLGTSYRSDYSNQQHASEKPPRQNGIQEGATIPGVSNGPGMSVVTPIDIMGRSRAPLPTGYGSDAGAAVWKRYPQTHKEDDLQHDSAVQQAPRPDESTALSEPAEEEYMEVTESCPQSPAVAPIADSEQRMAEISNSSVCQYCSWTFKVEELQEHRYECTMLLANGLELFLPEIFKHYQAHVSGGPQGFKEATKSAEDHIKEGIMSFPEFKVLLRHLMVECYEEHLGTHSQGGHDMFVDFREHVSTCPTFSSRCRQFWSDVVRRHNEPKEKSECSTNDQGTRSFQPEATPTREPEKTTAAMSFKEKYSVKDVKGFADGILIPFKEKLNPELACCICKALTPTGLKDGKGHTYCAYCTRVHTDALGLFTCSLCGWQAAPSEMSSNGEEWGILEKLTAACPNDNPKCTYQGTFKDVLVHYKSCALKTKVECPLCKSLHDRKTLAFHMAENCPKRVAECKFCNSDIEAWEKEIHEGSCRHRPGTCKYCLQEFSTIIELEEEHQPQCPKMPVKCSFYQLGCSFSAARSDVVVHEATTKHTDILMEHVCLLKAENESLKRTIENQEKKFQSIINNIKDSLPKIENRTNVAFERREPHFLRYDPFGINPYRTTLEGEGVSAGTRQKKIEERLAVVEEMLRSYQLPFEQLLRSISDLK